MTVIWDIVVPIFIILGTLLYILIWYVSLKAIKAGAYSETTPNKLRMLFAVLWFLFIPISAYLWILSLISDIQGLPDLSMALAAAGWIFFIGALPKKVNKANDNP